MPAILLLPHLSYMAQLQRMVSLVCLTLLTFYSFYLPRLLSFECKITSKILLISGGKFTDANPWFLFCVCLLLHQRCNAHHSPQLRCAKGSVGMLSHKNLEKKLCMWCILRITFLLFLVFYKGRRLFILMPAGKKTNTKICQKIQNIVEACASVVSMDATPLNIIV